jgi:HPt (histidine-containing phosphotransfer) domain-containing protein
MKMQVNISRIEEIVGDDLDMKKTLLDMFVNSCDKCIGNLKNSLSLPAPAAKKAWHDINHELKGSAYNLGFDDMGDHCAKVENAPLSNEEKQSTINIYLSARNDVEAILKKL